MNSCIVAAYSCSFMPLQKVHSSVEFRHPVECTIIVKHVIFVVLENHELLLSL